MSTFEFVSIVLSIVVGLAMTRVLDGLASVVRHRPISRSHWVTLVWTAALLLWLMVYWLGTVNSYRHSAQAITVAGVATLLAGAIALFFAASLILPDDIGANTNLEQHFAAIRPPFFLALASVSLFEFLDTLSHGVGTLRNLGWAYGTIVAGTFAGSLVGFFSTSKRTHEVLCLLSLLTAIGWLLSTGYAI